MVGSKVRFIPEMRGNRNLDDNDKFIICKSHAISDEERETCCSLGTGFMTSLDGSVATVHFPQ